MNLEEIKNAKTMTELNGLACTAGFAMSDNVLWADDGPAPYCRDRSSLGCCNGNGPVCRDLRSFPL